MAHGGGTTVVKEAAHFSDAVLPAMLDIRAACDTLEGLVAHDLWGMPTYEEMLFIK
jgi:glutamine synthetase